MHILIAPNAFKNSLDAEAAAKAIADGLMQSKLSCTLSCFPLGDGGDGTGSLLLEHLKGKAIPCQVHDPLGRKINSSFGLINQDQTAVIELSAASGLRHLKREEYNPLRATTRGTGEMIQQALDLGVHEIILAIGGSASVDGGAGILESLGIRFLAEGRRPLADLPESLGNLNEIDLSGLDPRIRDIDLTVLCDVDNLLLGQKGAAHVFGPQKGASVQQIAQLEAGLGKLRSVALGLTGKDMAKMEYGGAAGGVAAGLSVFLHAKLVSGIEYFLDHTGFDQQLSKADLLITAEGSMDAQTIGGKGPSGAAKRAHALGVKVIGLAGSVPLETPADLQSFFDVLLAIGNEPMDLEMALRTTAVNLKRTSRAIGNCLHL